MDSRASLRFVTFLTFARFPLVLCFFAVALFYSLYHEAWRLEPVVFWTALGFLVTSALTDIFDGYFARRLNVQTRFGAHADPLMDKFFYLSTLPLLVFIAMNNGHRNHAVILLVLSLFFLARDQWVTFLRSIGAIYNVPGGAAWIGKMRTIINFPLICVIYHFEEAPTELVNDRLLLAFEALAFVINILSVWLYTRRYWPYIRQAATPPG